MTKDQIEKVLRLNATHIEDGDYLEGYIEDLVDSLYNAIHGLSNV